MFIENKYKKWYDKIIFRALFRSIDIYENHHIIPKSLGGSNNKDNIVKLTPKEHFICHHLLVKMTYGKNQSSMKYAFWSMTRNTKHTHRRYTSRQYEIAKKHLIEARKNKSWNEIYGKEKAELMKKRLSEVHKGIPKPWAGSNGLHPKTGHNRAAKVWEVTDPDSIKYILIGSEFTDFCKKHKLSKGNFSTYGKTKGFEAKCLGLASKLT